MDTSKNEIVIIGNGISGITAARNIRKNSKQKITIISGETEYFYSRTALMYIFMGHMKYEHTMPYEIDFWKKNNIQLIFDWVIDIDCIHNTVLFKSKEPVRFDKLILALGSKPNKFGWKGQELDGVQGLYHFQDLELLEKNSLNCRQAVIIGGGLIGIELAEMLMSRGIEVTFLIREKSFWSNVLPLKDSQFVTNHILTHHITLKFETELKEIVGDEFGRVKHIITSKDEILDCQLCGLTAGVSPNIQFLKNTKVTTDRGVLVNEYFETNVPNIYAIGDCAQFENSIPGRRTIEQVWYTGKIMGETIAKTICGNRSAYNPGNWFNSAKFFDLEYQTYGVVSPILGGGQEDFYWEKNGKAMHFVFESQTRKFLGINSFGLRLRHESFDKWLTAEKSIEFVLEHLVEANFNPEFSKHYETDIIKAFNTEKGKSLKSKKKAFGRIFSI